MSEMPAPAQPRDASTVIVLRDGPVGGGLEVCMVSRPAQSSFAARALVFPGGVVDPADASDELLALAPRFDVAAAAVRARLGGGGEPLCAALHIAAVRELFEEVGLLLGDQADGSPAQAPALAGARAALLAGSSFATALRDHRLRIAPERLCLVAHLVTPASVPRRYDTRFFACLAPPGQGADPHLPEATSVAWLRPGAVLEQHRDDWRRLMPPTRIMLRELADHRSAGEAIADLGARPVARVLFTPRQLAELRLPDRLPLPGTDESAT